MSGSGAPEPGRAGGAGFGSAIVPWLSRHRLKLLVSLLIAALFVWMLHAGALPLVPGREAFSRVRWWTVPVYLVLWVLVHTIRALRWYWLLAPIRRVPIRTLLPVSLVGYAAILMFPFRTGEAVRPVLLHRRGGVSGWAAMGSVAAERIIDGLFLSILLFVALQLATPLDPLPDHIGELPVPVAVVPGAAYATFGTFFVALSVMSVFYWRRQWARDMTQAVVGLVSPALARWLATRIETVAQGLHFLPRLRFTVPFLLATLAYWALHCATAWLLAWGCGFDSISFAEACVTVGVLGLGALVPNAPGFFGAFQMSAYAGFAMYFPAADVVSAGAAYVFVAYGVQVAVILISALVSATVAGTRLLEGLDPGADGLEAASHFGPPPA
jgi:uncharacterized protein (TIRG00374 family)